MTVIETFLGPAPAVASSDRFATPPTTSGPATLADLALDLDGVLVLPGDDGWDEARQAWHLEVDQRPAAVALVRTARDVAVVVAAAAQLGLQVAGQSTGHNAAPLGDLARTILVRTSAMRGVTVDPGRRLARAEAGAWWKDVTDAAAEHGLAALAGSSPDVGVVGYALGGGLSWLARSHGLCASSVTALEVVTADGRQRRVDADHDPDLFWALRGGGGAFALVTAVELRLFPLTHVQAGVLFFPIERAGEVLQAWRAWLPGVPEAVTSIGRILRFPPLPELPPVLAGKAFVVVELASQLDPAATDELLAPLRALGPAMDTVHPTPMTELSQLHMDPPGPVPGAGDGMLLSGLDADAVEAFVAASDATGPALLSMELRQLGGSVGRPDPRGGAVSSFDADVALFAVGITPTPEAHAAVVRAVDTVQHRMAPWSTGGCYLNFAERPKAGRALFGRATLRRLRRVKAQYDPSDLVRSNHPVTPATHEEPS